MGSRLTRLRAIGAALIAGIAITAATACGPPRLDCLMLAKRPTLFSTPTNQVGQITPRGMSWSDWWKKCAYTYQPYVLKLEDDGSEAPAGLLPVNISIFPYMPGRYLAPTIGHLTDPRNWDVAVLILVLPQRGAV